MKINFLFLSSLTLVLNLSMFASSFAQDGKDKSIDRRAATIMKNLEENKPATDTKKKATVEKNILKVFLNNQHPEIQRDQEVPYYKISGSLDKIESGLLTKSCGFKDQKIIVMTEQTDSDADKNFTQIKCGDAEAWAKAVHYRLSNIHGYFIDFKIKDDNETLKAHVPIDAQPNNVGPK